MLGSKRRRSTKKREKGDQREMRRQKNKKRKAEETLEFKVHLIIAADAGLDVEFIICFLSRKQSFSCRPYMPLCSKNSIPKIVVSAAFAARSAPAV